jgi:uncharacterized protein (DUF2235 family)
MDGTHETVGMFFDGTWDSSEDKNVTNVVKLKRAVPETDHAGVEEVTHYETGIATEYTGRLRFWAGVLSLGLGRRVQSAYRFLCEHYESGDQIYLFGFSRGAFEARTLAELVFVVGIVRRDARKRTPQAWRYYRRYGRAPGRMLRRLRRDAHFPVRIACVGVWDTVGTLGMPFARRQLESRISELPLIVDVGIHALAIDEPRRRTQLLRNIRSSNRHGSREATRMLAAEAPQAHCRTLRFYGWLSASLAQPTCPSISMFCVPGQHPIH